MEHAKIRQVLADQKEELERDMKKAVVDRDEEEFVNLESSLAQVVMGVRRSGKSTLCKNVLRKRGKKYAYVNFDDERLYRATSQDLDRILENLYRIYGDFEVLFIDEIQNIDEWYLFVNRLLRSGMRVLITGSNSKLLSSELATHLTGRNHPIVLYPFSFRDFCRIDGIDTDSMSTRSVAFQKNAFDKFLETGAFPELLTSKEEPISYIEALVSAILTNDIMRRHRINYKHSFTSFAHHLLNLAPLEINPSKLASDFGFGSSHTAENYISYLEKAFLILPVHKYSPKSRIRLTETKEYAVDLSLMNRRKDAFSGPNLGWRLETAVCLELLKRTQNRSRDIFYLKERCGECDFLVTEGRETLECIQVSYSLSSPKTLSRELNGLAKAHSVTGCTNLTLITYEDERDIALPSGITVKVRPAFRWLLDPGL